VFGQAVFTRSMQTATKGPEACRVENRGDSQPNPCDGQPEFKVFGLAGVDQESPNGGSED
jgi:hypothetical protein